MKSREGGVFACEKRRKSVHLLIKDSDHIHVKAEPVTLFPMFLLP